MKTTRLAGLVLALGLLATPPIRAEISVTFSLFAPPPLPVYVQPAMPAAGYLWTPGYWAWDPVASDYYWVPGTWVRPPRPGYLWTPGYWAWSGGQFRWSAGYWATRVGFYGGIDYGFGYVGNGYQGGRWEHGALHYNTAVNNINTTVVKNVNVYNTKVVNITRNTVSYNGGNGGVDRRPTREEEQVKLARHETPTKSQMEHDDEARQLRAQHASVNKGRPEVAATPAPKDLKGPGVAKATNPETTAGRGPGRDAAAKNTDSAQRLAAGAASGARTRNADHDHRSDRVEAPAAGTNRDPQPDHQATTAGVEPPRGSAKREPRVPDHAEHERDPSRHRDQQQRDAERHAHERGQQPPQQSPSS